MGQRDEPGDETVDLTVVAIPVYFGSMGAEYLWLRGHADRRGPTPADYEWRDTVASLSMGVGSLVAPLVMPKLLGPLVPGKGKHGKVLVATAAGAVALTTVADVVARLAEPDPGSAGTVATGSSDRPGAPEDGPEPLPAPNRRGRRRAARLARRVAGAAGVAAIVAGGVAITSTWASRTTMDRMWKRRRIRDLGAGPLALAAAVLGLGLRLLLEPPVHAREPLPVGDPRRAPLERALQPVDRAAPAGRRRLRGVRALQPALPCSGSGPS